LPREAFLYFNDVELQAARLGPWKLHVTRFNTWMYSPNPPEGRINLPLPRPELYNLMSDVDETHDRADRNPAIVSDVRSRMDGLIRGFPPDVQNAWFNTLGRKVYYTPAGALPVQIT
jgi:arylsulfatase A